MLFLNWSLLTRSGRRADSRSPVASPLTLFVTQQYSTPFLSALSSMSSTPTPFFLQYPRTALVGFPSPSNAIFAGGPLTSSTLSSCLGDRPLTTANILLGVPDATTSPCSRRSSARSSRSLAETWPAALDTSSAGSSSEPSSRRKSWADPRGSEPQASAAASPRSPSRLWPRGNPSSSLRSTQSSAQSLLRFLIWPKSFALSVTPTAPLASSTLKACDALSK
mmetsp:Transcript_10168/g.31021  ORF Transcript_10168/g.31021 Transcript_10168/m.31021 type:complete len:222 (-) Transcript_10168:1006-1671(-)